VASGEQTPTNQRLSKVHEQKKGGSDIEKNRPGVVRYLKTMHSDIASKNPEEKKEKLF